MKGQRWGPGARSGPVAVVRRGPASATSLEAELEGALTDAVGGDPPGPMLARRLERIAREILLRRGFPSARTVAHSDARETVVHIQMPPDSARVGALVIRVESAR